MLTKFLRFTNALFKYLWRLISCYSRFPVPTFTQSLKFLHNALTSDIIYATKIANTLLYTVCSLYTNRCYRVDILFWYVHNMSIEQQSFLNQHFFGVWICFTHGNISMVPSVLSIFYSLCNTNLKRSHNFQNEGLAACWDVLIL